MTVNTYIKGFLFGTSNNQNFGGLILLKESSENAEAALVSHVMWNGVVGFEDGQVVGIVHVERQERDTTDDFILQMLFLEQK